MSQFRLTGSPITITSDSLVIDAPLAKRGLYFTSEKESGPTPRSIAIGTASGDSLTTGTDNTFYGFNAGQYNTTGNFNTCLGTQAGNANILGNSNTYLGTSTAQLATGSSNTVAGYNSGYRGSGSSNTIYGFGSASNMTTGAFNVVMGAACATNMTTANRNIIIGHNGDAGQGGVGLVTGANNIIIASEVAAGTTSNSILVGKVGTHTSCTVAGITGVSQTGPNVPVTVNGSGQLGVGAVSLREKKEDIELIDEVANHEKLMRVQARNYTFRDWTEKILQHGVIIDEIKPIFPELVGQCHGQDFYVSYEQFIALLIADLQYAWKSMHNLESRLAALENKTVLL